MTKELTLKEQVKALREIVIQLAGYDPFDVLSENPTERPDYVAFGSGRHASLLGLVEVDGEQDEHYAYSTFTSPDSGKTYRLEDEVTPFMHYPDPMQMAKLVLRQKVSEFEAGPPPVPVDAPPLWVPTFAYT